MTMDLIIYSSIEFLCVLTFVTFLWWCSGFLRESIRIIVLGSYLTGDIRMSGLSNLIVSWWINTNSDFRFSISCIYRSFSALSTAFSLRSLSFSSLMESNSLFISEVLSAALGRFSSSSSQLDRMVYFWDISLNFEVISFLFES